MRIAASARVPSRTSIPQYQRSRIEQRDPSKIGRAVTRPVVPIRPLRRPQIPSATQLPTAPRAPTMKTPTRRVGAVFVLLVNGIVGMWVARAWIRPPPAWGRPARGRSSAARSRRIERARARPRQRPRLRRVARIEEGTPRGARRRSGDRAAPAAPEGAPGGALRSAGDAATPPGGGCRSSAAIARSASAPMSSRAPGSPDGDSPISASSARSARRRSASARARSSAGAARAAAARATTSAAAASMPTFAPADANDPARAAPSIARARRIVFLGKGRERREDPEREPGRRPDEGVGHVAAAEPRGVAPAELRHRLARTQRIERAAPGERRAEGLRSQHSVEARGRRRGRGALPRHQEYGDTRARRRRERVGRGAGVPARRRERQHPERGAGRTSQSHDERARPHAAPRPLEGARVFLVIRLGLVHRFEGRDVAGWLSGAIAD